MMKKKTYMLIASVLTMLSFMSAYHESASHHQKAESVVETQFQSADSADGEKSVVLMANRRS